MFVLAIITWIVAALLIIVGLALRNGWFWGSGIVVGLLGFLFFMFSASFTVDQGEAKVMKDWTGVVVGEPVATPGIHWKEPWVDAVEFDIRNQLAVFLGDGNQQYNGSPTNGPQITFTDKDGVSGNMDLVILYSIKAESTTELVKDYANQDDFRTKVIEQDIRSIPRDITGKFTTIRMLTDRVEVANEIRDALEAEWKDKGITIEDVSIQEIRYSDAVKARFEEAQNAQTDVVKANAALEKAKIDAQQQVALAEAEATAAVAKARGQAEANAILSASLTPQILQQRWIDAVAGSGTIIVPQDFTSLGNLSGAQ